MAAAQHVFGGIEESFLEQGDVEWNEGQVDSFFFLMSFERQRVRTVIWSMRNRV